MQAPSLRRALLPFLCLCASGTVWTQTSTPLANPQPGQSVQPDQFAQEPYFVQSLSSVISMNADGTGSRTQTVSIKVQSEAALRQFSVISVPFAAQTSSVEFLYARAVHPDGTTQETPVSSSIEQPAPVTREAPFYSDLKTRELPVRSLRVGDVLQWQTRCRLTQAEVPGQFWGQDNFLRGAVVLDEVHELRVPASLHVTVWTNPREGSASESTEEAQRVFRWRHKDLEPTVGPKAEAAKHKEETRPRTAEEEVNAEKGELPSIAWTTFPDWAAVGDWYRALGSDRTAPDAAIKAKVAELTAGKTSDLERAQAIYSYVSLQIRYIGVAFGVGRYQPHTAAEVFANQYGDCKDKETLLASMLQVAGLHADPVLIGAGVRFNPAVPSPASFNHVITRLALDRGEVWLDSTTEVAPWRALLSVLRDREALVIPASGPARIVHTPADLPYPAFASTALTGSLDPSLTSESQMLLTFRDDDELALRAVLRSTSPSSYGDFAGNLMRNLGFGGTTSDPILKNLDDPSQPLAISFHYQRVKEKDWGENRITAAFFPITLPTFDPKTPPLTAIQLGTPRTETSTVEMALPPGWNAELPEAVHAHAAFATCDVTYRRDAGKLVAERRLAVLQSKVPAAEYKQYQAWYDSSGASGVPFVQLVPPITAAKAVPDPTKPQPNAPVADLNATSDPKAAELVVEAGEKIRSMDSDGARLLLDQAKLVNPGERGLWTGYGAVASMTGSSREAIQDLQKELSLYPDELRLYRYLAVEQFTHGDHEGALATIRLWVKAAPTSPEAALALVQQLGAEKQSAEAFTEAKAAINRMEPTGGDLILLRLAAAQAQAALGEKAEAAASVAPLLKTVTDPMEVNDITYQLAEGNLDLLAAAAAQAGALASLEAESTGWTLTEAPLVLVRKQVQFATMWDTMGWILYRQGDFAGALGYLEAALRTRDEPVIREHLTAAAAALHNTSAAASARATEQKRRTFPLGHARGKSGTAEFRLLIAGGRIVRSGPPLADSSGDSGTARAAPVFAGAEALLASADLHTMLPPGSNAHLVRDGFVTCHSDTCELVLAPLGTGPRMFPGSRPSS